MKVLVIGLGSMGKRRIRNLKKLNIDEIHGFDVRMDRVIEAESRYGIKGFDSFEDAIQLNSYNAFIISVPPDVHHLYMEMAYQQNIPFFVEASVLSTGIKELIDKSKDSPIVMAPSSTMLFHPAIKIVNDIIESQSLGRISCITYHSGQFLPDWHTYEKVSDFYVSKRETGGAREIVPFELTWIVKIFGFPESVFGTYLKTIVIEGAENIDDTYCGIFDYKTFILNLTVDVVSRSATRRLLINGSKGQLIWDWNEGNVLVYEPENGWSTLDYEIIGAEEGYNKNITEQMYVDEIHNFLNAINGKEKFANSLGSDYKVLQLLYALEESSDSNKKIYL